IDYGMGNLASVAKALERVGARSHLTDDPGVVRRAGALVLPGVGAFGEAARRLGRDGLGEAVADRIAAGVPFLGICLGLQLLFDGSDEGAGAGLGVFAGRAVRLPTTQKVPQIGWNELRVRPAGRRLAAGLPAPIHVYFVHSYCVVPADPAIVAATTDYGGEVVAAVAADNVWAVQFHPEKSSSTGLSMLAAFVGDTA
ncbi:MAG TPA: imidazole glycerol phosphate synthase subunit HisH, partial [Thermoleophilia bacterium]|nr:imidazole glycerol phosphate synthase subunit HisH [Thermoleophilia bacterium]